MKNVQLIDSAENCPFGIFRATDDDFTLLFPGTGQDIQYVEDLPAGPATDGVLARLFDNPIRKREAMGIHGVLFRGLTRYKRYYRDKREDSIDPGAINDWERLLLGTAGRKPSVPPPAPIDPADCRNIQTIDGALNATFSIWRTTAAEFALIFPEPGQEIQFAQDAAALPRQRALQATFDRLWQRPVRKRDAMGVHGTIFYGPDLLRYKRWYREKREDAIDPAALNPAQRRLFGVG